MKKVFFLIFMLMFLLCCGFITTGPEDPNDDPNPEPEYRILLNITYTRDPSKIRYPGGVDQLTGAKYELYDIKADENRIGEEKVENNYRIGEDRMEKKAENYFIANAEKAFVQGDNYNFKHKIWIRDHKLHDGIDAASMKTTEGMTVEPDDPNYIITEVSFFNNEMHFKLKRK